MNNGLLDRFMGYVVAFMVLIFMGALLAVVLGFISFVFLIAAVIAIPVVVFALFKARKGTVTFKFNQKTRRYEFGDRRDEF
ncbi:hypothetical protein E1162_17240 [Rhodobacteraceae bacterium RKSG542]|uniref:hypothetical protein n=1 Tax=Pseudovibrio flavus TaxID=2529854 RepID=UPI0012BC83BB|nr:hypothetical protein [Pseudovibrio flavus]MTI18989.1 hypothetical protein [Pseudovibrio flavus]